MKSKSNIIGLRESGYGPGEKEAIDSLESFEEDLKTALKNKLGDVRVSCTGAPVTFNLDISLMYEEGRNSDNVEVLVNADNVIMKVLTNTFQISESDIDSVGPVKIPSVKSSYQRQTENGVRYEVDFKETKNKKLKVYMDYIKKKLWGPMDESFALTEGISGPVQDRVGNFLWDAFVTQKYTSVSFPPIADFNIGKDFLDVAFDLKDEGILKPEITKETLLKHMDEYMKGQFLVNFFRYYKVTPFFTLEPDGVEYEDDILVFSYKVVNTNSSK